MEVGDRIRIDGRTGRLAAHISAGKFSPEYPAEHWAYLEVGALVDTDELGLVHYPDFDELEVETIPD